MQRFCFLIVLMLLSSSFPAGNSFSFVVGGHRIRIKAPRHCHSPSCVSVSIPGVYQARRGPDRDEDDRDVVEPVKAPVAAPPPAVFRPAAAATQEVAPPQPAIVLPPVPPPPAAMTPPAEKPAEAVRPPAVVAPRLSRVSHQVEDQPADTPVGDWQSEGSKGASASNAVARRCAAMRWRRNRTLLLSTAGRTEEPAVLLGFHIGEACMQSCPLAT